MVNAIIIIIICIYIHTLYCNFASVYTNSVQECMPKSECSLAAAVSSSVLTFIATSIIIFITGFVIGRYFRLSKGKLHITTTDQPHQGPVYDYVQPSTAKPQENLELTANVAYHPSKSITIEH